MKPSKSMVRRWTGPEADATLQVAALRALALLGATASVALAQPVSVFSSLRAGGRLPGIGKMFG
jgi:hypothetical protein